jgi:hypothetical protein
MRPGGDGGEGLVEENAKGECRDEYEEEAVYQRGEIGIVEKGQGENQAGEETCQSTKKDAGKFHVLIIKGDGHF